MANKLVPDSDNAIWVDKLYDRVEDEFITTGTVTFEVKDPLGNTVGSGSMTYVGGPNQSWVGVLEDGTTLTVGTVYSVIVLATASSDRVRRFDLSLPAMRSAA